MTSGWKTEKDEKRLSGPLQVARNFLFRTMYALNAPGTPPVADSTVGIASTPNPMVVLTIRMVAFIL